MPDKQSENQVWIRKFRKYFMQLPRNTKFSMLFTRLHGTPMLNTPGNCGGNRRIPWQFHAVFYMKSHAVSMNPMHGVSMEFSRVFAHVAWKFYRIIYIFYLQGTFMDYFTWNSTESPWKLSRFPPWNSMRHKTGTDFIQDRQNNY